MRDKELFSIQVTEERCSIIGWRRLVRGCRRAWRLVWPWLVVTAYASNPAPASSLLQRMQLISGRSIG